MTPTTPEEEILEDEPVEIPAVTNYYDNRRDIRALQAILSTIIGVCIIVAVTATVWHGVDSQRRTRVARARADQQNSAEWQTAFEACKKDYSPHLCMEAAHGIDIGKEDNGP